MIMESCSSTQTFSQSPLTVHNLKTITGALAVVLSKAYGPKGKTTLLVSSTGQASMVKDGLEMLLCLHLSHPVAKTIQQAAMNLIDVYGDGCKTMVIYLNALFCALDKEITQQPSCFGSCELIGKNQMRKALHVFLVNDFPALLSDVRNFINEQMQRNMESRDFSWLLLHVISTYLNGCIPPPAVQIISKLVLEYIKMDNSKIHDFQESWQWFSSSVFIIPNKLYSSSHLESGIILQRPLMSNKGMDTISCVKMVCMLCSLDSVGSTEREEEVCLLKDPEKILQYRQKLGSNFIAALKRQDVSLIICNTNVPSYISHICQTFRMAVVDCVEESDIDFICQVTSKSPVTSLFEDISYSCLMDVSSCTQFVEGQSTFTKVVFDGDLRWIPRSLFFCAPSEALGKQLKKSVERCLIIVYHLLNSNDSYSSESSFQTHIDVEEDAVRLLNTVCGGGYFEMVMCQILYDFSSHERASSTQRWCCGVLMQMLTASPHILRDTFLHQNRKQEGWLGTLNAFQRNIRNQSVPCGLNSDGQLCNPCDLGVVEVLSLKIGTLYSALTIATSLLNVDEMISVRSSKPWCPP